MHNQRSSGAVRKGRKEESRNNKIEKGAEITSPNERQVRRLQINVQVHAKLNCRILNMIMTMASTHAIYNSSTSNVLFTGTGKMLCKNIVNFFEIASNAMHIALELSMTTFLLMLLRLMFTVAM